MGRLSLKDKYDLLVAKHKKLDVKYGAVLTRNFSTHLIWIAWALKFNAVGATVDVAATYKTLGLLCLVGWAALLIFSLYIEHKELHTVRDENFYGEGENL